MHPSVLEFVESHLTEAEVRGKAVLEVGSLNVNGSVREHITSLQPRTYVGIDIRPGDGVDVLCDIGDLVAVFGKESFDMVVSTGTLEHVEDWRKGTSNIKNVCKNGGLVLLTAPSVGFPFHAFPGDYWRFGVEDMREIFSDLEILAIEEDPTNPGVFVKATKPVQFVERDLSGYSVHSMGHAPGS